MTRFARAKGSKSSNEKLPEEGTPWSEMKKSCLVKQQEGSQETSLISYYKNSVKEEKQLEWCSLDEENEDCLNLLKNHLKKDVIQKKSENSTDLEKKRKKKKKFPEAEGDPLPQKKVKKEKNFTNVIGEINGMKEKPKKVEKNGTGDETKKDCTTSGELKKKSKKNDANSISEDGVVAKKVKVKKSKSKGKMNEEKNEEESLNTTAEIEGNVSMSIQKRKKNGNSTSEDGVVAKKMKVKKSKPEGKMNEEKNEEESLNTTAEIEGNVSMSIQKRKKNGNSTSEDGVVAKKMKVKKSKPEGKMSDDKNEEESINTTKNKKDVKILKHKKSFESGEKKPKKLDPKAIQTGEIQEKFKHDGNKFTTKINIGGEMVSLIKFQGYYVTKDDAKKLKKMKKKLQEEGIPENQIEAVIKLERRKCEKSLARMKKNVCFQCRKPGHLLSECPEVQNKIETGTGICYKCGSTEHKAFTCKVMHKEKFPFAECFICKEKGHIARECPDNPRGLYPNGGCCKLCGDVTHLKKDCPTKILENDEKTIKVGLRDDRNVEGLEEVVQNQETNKKKKPKKKLVTY